MAELKTKPTTIRVEEFIKRVEPETKQQDSWRLLRLMEEVTGEKAVMWGDGMVGFGKYEYKYRSGREGEWMLTGFVPRKNQLTVYIMDGFEGREELLDELGKYKTGVSCLYIRQLDEVDMGGLKELISRSVKQMRKINS